MIRIREGYEPKEVGVVVREELEKSNYINNVDVSIEDDVISIIFSSINEINFQEFGLRLKKALE